MAGRAATSSMPDNGEPLGKELLRLAKRSTDDGARAKELIDAGANLDTVDEVIHRVGDVRASL